MENKKLFLIDAMAIIFRAYYAFNKNPRINSKGQNTSAIFGFANTLLDILKQNKPTHIGVAFDLHGPTVRHEQYEEYKANRLETPEDILFAIPIIKDLVKAMNIPMLAVTGYEADDVIGTLAKKAARNGFTVYMVTPDKDYAQLVEENILMYKPGRMGSEFEILGVEEVKEKFSVKRPEQVVDILGLWGDSSDNIPGVPSIGEKKAKLLMQDFDSIEDILENTDKIESKSIRKAIEENKDKAILSKELARIILDVPIEFDEEKLKFENPNPQECKRLFDELEFKTFEKRFFTEFEKLNLDSKSIGVKSDNNQMDLFGDNNSVELSTNNSLYNNISNTEHNYRFIEDDKTREELLLEIKERGYFCFDTETLGLEIDSPILGLSFSTNPFTGYFLYLDKPQDQIIEILKDYKEVFEDKDIEKIGHNMKFDKNILLNYGIKVEGKCFDTILAHYLINSESRHKLDILSQTYLNYEMIPFESLGDKKIKTHGLNPKTLDKERLKEYAVEDSDICLQLKNIFEEKLREAELLEVFEKIEMPLVDVLLSMEREGVRLNIEELNQFSTLLNTMKIDLEKEIYSLSGEEFNISSPKQLGEILFEKMDIDSSSKKKGKSKQYSTAEDVLVKLKSEHPIIEKVLEYRSLSKLKGTYVDALPLLVNKKTNHIHTSYNQSTAVTGRLSSKNPNLQNIPIRTELGKEIRKCFVPRNKDFVLLAADYSQIELRIIASLSGDENMCEAFKKNLDIHLDTASKIYGVSHDEVTKDMRRNAKSVNFGIIYGISAFGLSQQLNISRKEAQELIDEYFNKYPKIKTFIDKSIISAREKGYAETISGRRRYLSDIKSSNANIRNFAERNAVNMPIQGTSADMIKLAMISIYKEFNQRNLKSKMILQVHDELVFDVFKPELDIIKEIVVNEMKNSLKLNLPIEVEVNTGKNWLEAH